MTQNECLNYLLTYLLNERGLSCAQIPASPHEQRHLLRALMNLREPSPAGDEFIRVQNEYLHEEINKKGITYADSLPFVSDKLCLWQGDITTLACDAIVNAANSAMLGCFVPCHGCIDNAIHTFAGVQLRMECSEIMKKQGCPEPTGKAKLTSAYCLPCKYILHTVGPVALPELTDEHCAMLAECYRSCLSLAEKFGLHSIAFCCISTGEFRFPNQRAAEIAVSAVKSYLKNSSIERVIFNVYKDIDREIYRRLLSGN